MIYRSPEAEAAVRGWCRERLNAWDVPHRTLTLRTGLGATTVVSAGQGPGVLLLPGTNFCAATSLRIAEPLLGEHTVFLADLPGQPGLSAADRPGGNRLFAYGRWATEAPLAGHAHGSEEVFCL